MVKRTLVVLSVLSLMLMAAGTSFAMFGWGGGGCGQDCGPLYVPVDCPPVPGYKTIVKTWEAKIEGPCPAPMGCGPAACGKKWGPGLICSLVNAIATPLDWVFGGCDGVYGCFPGFGGGGGGCGAGGGDCGPCYGPVACALAAVPMVLGAPTTMFEELW